MYTISIAHPEHRLRLVRCYDGIYEVSRSAEKAVRVVADRHYKAFRDAPMHLAFDARGNAYLMQYSKEVIGIGQSMAVPVVDLIVEGRILCTRTPDSQLAKAE